MNMKCYAAVRLAVATIEVVIQALDKDNTEPCKHNPAVAATIGWKAAMSRATVEDVYFRACARDGPPEPPSSSVLARGLGRGGPQQAGPPDTAVWPRRANAAGDARSLAAVVLL